MARSRQATLGRRRLGRKRPGEGHLRRRTRELERQLAGRTVEAETAGRELASFCYSVSHDLRAELRSIDGFSAALLEDYGEQLDAGARLYLARLRAASQRLAAHLAQLLQLSRVLNRELHRTRVDVSALVREVADALHAQAPDRRVTFTVADGVWVYADPAFLRAVVENLLANAWKFTSGHAAACIEFGRVDGDGEAVYYVRDDGAGFDMAFAGRLFEPFQRLHGATEFEGSGVGLAIVQRAIRRHGGRVWAEAAVEQGATVYFTLPELEWSPEELAPRRGDAKETGTPSS